MNIHASDLRSDFNRALIGFISLLGSSVISALGFILVASNRIIVIEPAIAIFIILYVQWQTLGLTIAKLGIEQVVFAMVSADEQSYLNPITYLIYRVFPLASVFSVVVLFVFSPWAAVVAFGTILLDTYSLIIIADLNARKRFKATAISNLCNYPLFFMVLFFVNVYGKLSITTALTIFLVSSFVRAVWLRKNQVIPQSKTEVVCRVNIQMGLQQALNYLMFRADQIVLALIGLNSQFSENLSLYVFLAKFPELLSGVLVIAGTVFFPKYYLKYPFSVNAIISKCLKNAPIFLFYAALVLLAFLAYSGLWKGSAISPNLLIPFFVHSLFILLANNITYSALRQGYLRRLLMNLAISAFSGLVMAIVVLRFDVMLLAWAVPLQLLVFIILTLLFKWGRPVGLYG